MATRKTDKTDKTPTEQLVAKFQLDTEKALAAHRAQFDALLKPIRTELGRVQSSAEELRALYAGTLERVEHFAHEMTQGVKETREALSKAVKMAAAAEEAAQVYEKLQEAAPDWEDRLRQAQRAAGKASDRLTALESQVNEAVGELSRHKKSITELKLTTDSTTRLLERPVTPLGGSRSGQVQVG